ncbi:MAG: hypothetical protein KDA41_16925, partial [Planctomycetales bacterium]|nr:hypothetical protein [Planctomycetales bacterium]
LLSTIDAGSRQYQAAEAAGQLTDAMRLAHAKDQTQLARLQPRWLRWSSIAGEDFTLPDDPAQRRQAIEDRARAVMPQVLAAFDNNAPYLVDRRIGRGRVVFCSSGVMPQWNTVARTNTMLLFDRLLRGMLRSTLPARNFVTQDRLSIPLETNSVGLTFELHRPAADGEETIEELRPGYLGSQQRGLTIANPLHQGIYTIVGFAAGQSADPTLARQEVWRAPLAVNVSESGGAGESDLTPLTAEQFHDQLAGDAKLRWVGANEEISLAGATIRGQDWWKRLALAVLVLLLVEIAILAWPAVVAPPVAAATEPPGVPTSVR